MTFKENAFWRYALYSALANYYLPPTKDCLTIANKLIKNQDFCLKAPSSIQDTIVLLSKSRQSFNTILDDYHYLFIGITGGIVPIYGSVYLSGSTYDKPLADLREDLTSLGISRSENNHEPEDHLASLFEVMATLVADFSKKEQVDFFYKHIDLFINQFCDQLIKEKSIFYRNVARLTQVFIQTERQSLVRLASVSN